MEVCGLQNAAVPDHCPSSPQCLSMSPASMNPLSHVVVTVEFILNSSANVWAPFSMDSDSQLTVFVQCARMKTLTIP